LHALFGCALLGALPACSGKSARHGEPSPSGDAGASGAPTGAGVGGGASGSSGGGSEADAGEAGESSGGASPGTTRSELSLPGAPIYTRAQRLTNAQWERAVTDILRLPAAPNLAQNFEPPVAGVTDFTNNEHVLTVTLRQFESYELAAEAVSALATGSADALTALDAGTDAEGFVREFGRRAFRRPLTDEEVERYLAVFLRGEELYGAGFANGAGFVVRTMLQSPHFLYRTELGEAGAPLNGYEVASKLSFWLRGTTPSDALLDSAAAGELDTEAGLEALARQMLQEPTAVDVLRDLNTQWLRLQLFDSVAKNGVPEYDEAVNPELEQASHAFLDRLFQQNLGLRDILTSTVGFVGPLMAPLYGVPAPAAGLEERDLGSARPGFFAQAPFLIVNSINNDPDTVRRGFTIHFDVLCADTGSPGIEMPSLPPFEANQTNRQRLGALTEGCGGECHNAFINPLGFAFESYDGMGRERSLDNGMPVDTQATYPFASGTKTFSGAPELMQILASEPQAHLCYAKQIAGYALQRDIVESDRTLLTELAANFEQSTKEMMLSLVRNPSFRLRSAAAQ
jgi:hypothetical protein